MLNESGSRRSSRIYVQMPIRIMAESEGQSQGLSQRTTGFLEAATVDFSPLGCRVRAYADFSPGASVALLLGKNPLQPCHGQVIWASRPDPSQLGEVGLQFTQPFAQGSTASI